MRPRQWLWIFWHTRLGHSPGLIVTRRGVAYCAGCGRVLP